MTHHVASRTQFSREFFVPQMRDEIEEILKDGVTSGGGQLVAHAIMPTHFHALIIQGQASLGYVLQPVLRRIALLTQRYHRLAGHVFERRFRSRICATAQHLRNSVLYIHRNPLAARLCSDLFAYPWTSHRDYTRPDSDPRLSVRAGLEFVAGTRDGDDSELRDIYDRAFREYCGVDDDEDFAWTTLSRRRRNEIIVLKPDPRPEFHLPDLRDVAVRTLNEIEPGFDIEMLRNNFKIPKLTKLREELIACLCQRGYSTGAIAKYLYISDSTVSRIRSRMRWASRSYQTPPSE